MTEDDTFNALKRSTFEELHSAVNAEWAEFKLSYQFFYNSDSVYRIWETRREELAKEHYWKWLDYVAETNRRIPL